MEKLATVLEVIGAIAITVGLTLIFRPLGFLSAGIFCFLASAALQWPEVEAQRQTPNASAAHANAAAGDEGDVDDQEELEEPAWAESIPDRVKLTKGGLVRE